MISISLEFALYSPNQMLEILKTGDRNGDQYYTNQAIVK